MTRKRRRLIILVAAMASIGIAGALIVTALRDNDTIALFVSPTRLVSDPPPAGRRIRVGGLVEVGSVVKSGLVTRFSVHDGVNTVPVIYTGLLPDLFREGQGVVAGGKVDQNGLFTADEILAKHDEKYMPPEVADALKRGGQWKPGDQ